MEVQWRGKSRGWVYIEESREAGRGGLWWLGLGDTEFSRLELSHESRIHDGFNLAGGPAVTKHQKSALLWGLGL